MAEGWLRHFADRAEADVTVHSAGTEPGGVHPLAIEVMAESGVDLSGQRSKHLDEFIGKRLHMVVTVCDRARGACPDLSGLLGSGRGSGYKIIHHPFDDPDRPGLPADELKELFRRVRDEIRDWAQDFIQEVVSELDVGAAGRPDAAAL